MTIGFRQTSFKKPHFRSRFPVSFLIHKKSETGIHSMFDVSLDLKSGHSPEFPMFDNPCPVAIILRLVPARV